MVFTAVFAMPRTFQRTIIAGAISSACLLGCAGQSKLGKLQQAASDLNTATRFGRMDVANELVARESTASFAQRHAQWGRAIRIVDVELYGVQMVDANRAIVHVAIGWQHPDDITLRSTQLAQLWSYDQHGWRLIDETRTAGDLGLIGEPVQQVMPAPRADVHWPSRTIR